MHTMPTGNEDILGAVQYAVNFCNDETHGYFNDVTSTRNRWGVPDTDCSGLVWLALFNNGFDVGTSAPADMWNTDSMMSRLPGVGFTEYVYPWGRYGDYVPQHGDICVYRQPTHGHAFFYAENVLGFADKSTATRSTIAKARVEAIHDYNNAPGDSQYNGTGAYNEVWVHPFNGLYDADDEHRTWHVFRWGGGPGPTPITDQTSLGMLAGLAISNNKRRFSGSRWS